MTINKIVVMGCSFTKPGQSGITKCWSQWLQEQTNTPVINITWGSGGSNSEIARAVSEYVWNNDVSNTAFIIQWTNIERTEFCYDDAQWIQMRAGNNDGSQWISDIGSKHKNRATLTEQQLAISKRLLEAQILSYSISTYFWDWLQKLITVNHLLNTHGCQYFQWHMSGGEIRQILTKQKSLVENFNIDSIVKTIRKTPWLSNNVIKAEPVSFDCVSKDDPHPSNKGSEQLAQMFTAEVKRRGWL